MFTSVRQPKTINQSSLEQNPSSENTCSGSGSTRTSLSSTSSESIDSYHPLPSPASVCTPKKDNSTREFFLRKKSPNLSTIVPESKKQLSNALDSIMKKLFEIKNPQDCYLDMIKSMDPLAIPGSPNAKDLHKIKSLLNWGYQLSLEYFHEAKKLIENDKIGKFSSNDCSYFKKEWEETSIEEMLLWLKTGIEIQNVFTKEYRHNTLYPALSSLSLKINELVIKHEAEKIIRSKKIHLPLFLNENNIPETLPLMNLFYSCYMFNNKSLENLITEHMHKKSSKGLTNQEIDQLASELSKMNQQITQKIDSVSSHMVKENFLSTQSYIQTLLKRLNDIKISSLED